MTLKSALSKALVAAELHAVDGAAVALAVHYAKVLDADPRRTATIGPRLLQCLVELKMTPKARGKTRAVPVEIEDDVLVDLTARARARR